MAFDSVSSFLAMGGYAAYVWPAWGVTLALLVGAVIHARAERRLLMRDLKRRERRQTHVSSKEGVDAS
ncbi:heme exporter protein CcmD [Aidingimonas lacisalsi]|uniref:heme exporter protein CcmD n=1 Tax=Aidingimonas lacisalsi TaxID=2604086 RepID=UPI0011D22754|nr:heme exporter protein CcmD [Aidingimonas lacisalsi]